MPSLPQQPAPYYSDAAITLHHGDCLDVLRSLPDASVDSVVTDPPYGLGFMGRAWDALPPGLPWAQECFRVLKPGGHLLAFGGTRTWHRLAVAVEDGGFEIRDSLAWLYGSGFPKSMDVSKAIDKMDAGTERRARNLRFTEWLRATGVTSRQLDDATSSFMGGHYLTSREQAAVPTADMFDLIRPLLTVEVPEWVESLIRERTVESENYNRREVLGARRRLATGREGYGFAEYFADTAPATPDAERWQGWGTALKPSHEPIVVARKPLSGTVAATVLAHGTGALNIDGCRNALRDDETAEGLTARSGGVRGFADEFVGGVAKGAPPTDMSKGRWPANVVLDESQAEALDQMSGESSAGSGGQPQADARDGGASRFFYVAKADASERVRVNGTAHPTVKPLALMRWLVRLVTPPGGTVLEPFAGSGTTVEACILEGFHCIAIEREADYLPLIVQRIHRRRDPVKAIRGAGEDAGLFDFLDGGAA